MGTTPADFLEVDEYEKNPRLHRSRSGGYADYLEDQVQWDRRDRERQMKLYHDNRRPARPTQAADRLYVPAFDMRHRRVRSQDQISEIKEGPDRKYKLRQAVPSALYDSNKESDYSVELPLRQATRSQKKPKIKVHIHQDDLPASHSNDNSATRSPFANQRSSSAIPQLPFQYATLQHKLAQIETTCSPFLEVEGAHPHDLTFAKVSEQAKGFAFDLQVWGHVVSVLEMARIDTRKRTVVEAASRTLGRLIERATDLGDACRRAKPKDLKLEPLPDTRDLDDDLEGDDDETDQNQSRRDVTESLGFIIKHQLDNIQLQIQTLKTLARSLQEATPGAKEEVMAVGALVSEVDKYFGSQEAPDRYGIDTRFAGGRALEEVRHAAGHQSR